MILQDLHAAAVAAHEWNSSNPEQAAEVSLNGYEALLNDCLAKIPETAHEDFIEQYKNRLRGLFATESRIAGWFVTGRAKFNNARNGKANSAYDNRVKEFHDWCKAQVARGLKAMEACKTDEQRNEEEWQKLRKDILFSASEIIAIDNKQSFYTRSAFVNSIYNRTETYAKHGNAYVVNKAIEFVKELGTKGPKPLLTARHKFWKLPELCTQHQEAMAANAGKANKEIELEGVTVVFNYTADRLQLLFDDKPDDEMRTSLKRYSFRWSPSEGAWQRQITDNAINAAAGVLGVEMAKLTA